MNKQDLIKSAAYYTPAQLVTLAAGASQDITFTGLNGNRYGLNRMLFGGANLENIQVTAKLNKGRQTIIEDVQAAALRQLFLNRSLRGAFVIDPGTQLEITLTNNGAASQTVNAEIAGYTEEHLKYMEQQYSCKQLPFPKPYLVYGSDTVPAGNPSYRISMVLPAFPIRLYRMAVSSDSPGNLTATVDMSTGKSKTTVKPEVFIDQINDEFNTMDIIKPVDLEASVPFEFYLKNLDGANDHTFSFVAECYQV